AGTTAGQRPSTILWRSRTAHATRHAGVGCSGRTAAALESPPTSAPGPLTAAHKKRTALAILLRYSRPVLQSEVTPAQPSTPPPSFLPHQIPDAATRTDRQIPESVCVSAPYKSAAPPHRGIHAFSPMRKCRYPESAGPPPSTHPPCDWANWPAAGTG